jgi:transcription factor SPN1
MSDNDMFADSDDTDELIASTKSKSSKKDNKPDADNAFDSDSDDDEPISKRKKTNSTPSSSLSKKERLEALAKKRNIDEPVKSRRNENKSKSKTADAPRKKEADDAGYDSGDTYDSGDFQRTKEDDDFIDTTGEDKDALAELYAEQHFGDERPDIEGGGLKKKKKRQVRYDSDDPDNVGKNADLEPDNPIMAAVHRMKKKKNVKKGLSEMEEEIRTFLGRMEMAAEEDEQMISEKKPAIKKLSMLNEVCDMLTKRDMQRLLLDLDLLTVCKRWVQPLPNGTLGNVTVRQRIMEAIGNMTGESGITATDLKRSEFGKVVMILFKHRSETPNMKRQLKVLIEQWSRPIFQKSGNMKDLDRVTRGESGLAALSRQHLMTERQQTQASGPKGTGTTMAGRAGGDLNALIAGTAAGSKKLEAGVNRVRVPYSKGFAFQVRPSDRVSGGSDDAKRSRGNSTGGGGDTRTNLIKRMSEKGKPVGKNQRSANISVEGRATKG